MTLHITFLVTQHISQYWPTATGREHGPGALAWSSLSPFSILFWERWRQLAALLTYQIGIMSLYDKKITLVYRFYHNITSCHRKLKVTKSVMNYRYSSVFQHSYMGLFTSIYFRTRRMGDWTQAIKYHIQFWLDFLYFHFRNGIIFLNHTSY